ncbi:MAG: glycosyltransferase [Candidatus Methanoperedens sp.]
MLIERFDLPFDLYTRNKIISDLINLLRKKKKGLKILDIGGRSGHLKEFLQVDDDLYILDILKSESNEINYFVGDIISAPFKDRTFDVVVSSDLFEHISPENRENTLSEMQRISKNYVILGAPFYSEKAAEAEIQINDFFHKLTGNDHPWLFEHIKNGLPSGKKLEEFLKTNGFEYLTTETNNISNWLLMQLFIFYSYKYGIPVENVSRVYRFYNLNFLELGDSLNPAYRTIYLIGKTGTLPEIDYKLNSIMDVSKFHSLETLIFETIGQFTDNKEIHIHNLETILQDKDEHIQLLGTVVQKKEEYITGLETTVTNKDEYINGLKETVTNKDNYINGLKETVTNKENYINGLKETVTNKDAYINGLKETVTNKDKYINGLKETVTNKDNYINGLKETVTNKDDYINGLKETVTNKDEYINGLKETVTNKDEYINGLKETITNKDEYIQNLNSLIAQNNRKLNDIYNSTSWQILTKYRGFVNSIFPHNSRRRNLYNLGTKSFKLIANDGLGAFLQKFNDKLFKKNIYASRVPIVETKIVSPNVPLSLSKSLRGKFTFLSDNLNEIKIYTATNNRLNSDLILYIKNAGGEILRKTSVKGRRIQDNGYTLFSFKPIKDSKERTFFFELISKQDPGAVVWHNESVTFPELTLYYNDEPLNGSIGFQAFADIGVKSRYDIWILKNEPTAQKIEQYKKEVKDFEYQPKISILTPVYNPDVAWIDSAIKSVRSQVYENWELCLADASTKKDVKKCLEAYAKKDPRIKVKFLAENKGISENSNEALALVTGEYIGLLDHDDEISPDALYEVVKYLQTNRDAGMIYTDEDKIDLKGNRRDPFFKPDWSPDTFLSCMYTCHFGVYKKKIIDEIGKFRKDFDGSQDYDIVLRVMDKTHSIHHIPKILYHWRMVPGSAASAAGAKNYAYVAAKNAITDYMKRNNIDGEVSDGFWTGSYRMKRKLLGSPLVSMIIVSSDSDVINKCIENIEQATDYSNYEIVVINMEKQEPEVIAKEKVHIIQYSGSYNISKARNLATSHARGEYLLFLDENVEIITNDWLNALCENTQRPQVGAVGTKLINSSNQMLHCGITLGLGKDHVAGYPLSGFPSNIPGYFGNITIVKNCSAVTAACMMLRKDVFNEVNGFDENLAVAFSDVDLCLKLREQGYLIVYTPFAELIHHGTLNRDYNDAPDLQKLFLKDVEYIRKKWGNVIDGGDPYYSPNLTLDSEDYTIRI